MDSGTQTRKLVQIQSMENILTMISPLRLILYVRDYAKSHGEKNLNHSLYSTYCQRFGCPCPKILLSTIDHDSEYDGGKSHTVYML